MKDEDRAGTGGSGICANLERSGDQFVLCETFELSVLVEASCNNPFL